MGSTRKRGEHRGRPFWEKTIGELNESSESISAFAQARGLGLSSLHRWRKRLRDEADTSNLVEQPSQPEFVEVVVPPIHLEPHTTHTKTAPLSLHLANITLDFNHTPHPLYLAQLIREVLSC